MPESNAEILDGRLLIVPGADPPHARRHAALAYLLSAHVAEGHAAAIDMLTRTSARSDFAPDASVYPTEPDVATGARRLEAIAFEIVSRQRLAISTRKARELARRGVRRVLAIVLERERVLEWDRRTGRWRPMHVDEEIADAALSTPLPVRALLDTARADEAVLRAIEARRPELLEAFEARAEARELRRGIARLCAALEIPLGPARRRRLERLDGEGLRSLADAIATSRRWPRGR